MPESFTKDPAIKLFGKKIPLLAENNSAATTFQHLPSPRREEEEEEEKAVKDFPEGQINENILQDDASPPETEDSAIQETLVDSNGSPSVPSVSEESAKSEASKSDKEQSDAANSEGKTLKKPDKILPCPRCNSMDTKFCYYNNYNVNQPRHFCKACQRYWTAGGTMRNVPVGAGRRKNKNAASHYRHITISEALQVAHMEAPNGKHLPALKPDGRVLSFSLDAPMCDSMASVLKLVDKNVLNGTQNGFHRSFEEQKIPVPCKSGDNGDDCLSGSSVTGANSREEVGRNGLQEPYLRNTNGCASSIPCFPAVPWPYPWNSTLPPPSFCPPGLPMPLYPTPYWNCGITSAWNIPLQPPHCSSSLNQTTPCSGPNSPTLGKHSRDAGLLKPDDLEKERPSKHKNGCLVVPKILRIDDPSEAAKSSIWTTLGIKNESLSNGGLFKAFKPKSAGKSSISDRSPALRANPAALSRSISFHESS